MNSRQYRRPCSGLTLVELIIVISLIGLIAAFSFPFYRSYSVQQQFDAVSDELSASLHRAQGKAGAGDHGVQWGLHWDNQSYTIFAGSDYTNRIQDQDMNVSYPASILIDVSNISGTIPFPHDVIFDQLTSTTSTTGTIIIQSSAGDTTQFSIYNSGQIERQ